MMKKSPKGRFRAAEKNDATHRRSTSGISTAQIILHDEEGWKPVGMSEQEHCCPDREADHGGVYQHFTPDDRRKVSPDFVVNRLHILADVEDQAQDAHHLAEREQREPTADTGHLGLHILEGDSIF